MTFIVTYRDRSGAKREDSLEAASRAACAAACRARGISPLAIREGGRGLKGNKGPNGDSRRPRRNSAFPILLFAFAIAVVAAIALVWWLGGNHGEPSLPPEKPKASNVSKDGGEKSNGSNVSSHVVTPAVPQRSQTAPLPPWDESFIKNREMRTRYSTLISATTNDDGMVVERYRLPDGRTWRRMVDPPPLFSNVSDQAIAMVMSSPRGGLIPPVPGLESVRLEKEFVDSLAIPIHIEPDDPPRVTALKMIVKETREEIVRLKGDGDTRTVGQMLKDHILVNNQNAGIRADAAEAVRRVRETEGEEAAKAYLDAVNKHLEASGVRPLGAVKGKRSSGRERPTGTEPDKET